jgi:hypothetical protein
VTYVLTWPHIDALGWFLLVTGPLVILGAMFFPPRVICDDNGRPVTGNAAVCETTDD